MMTQFAHGNSTYHCMADKTAAGYRVIVDGRLYDVTVVQAGDGSLTFQIGNVVHTACWAIDGSRLEISVQGKTVVLDGSRAVAAAQDKVGDQGPRGRQRAARTHAGSHKIGRVR